MPKALSTYLVGFMKVWNDENFHILETNFFLETFIDLVQAFFFLNKIFE